MQRCCCFWRDSGSGLAKLRRYVWKIFTGKVELLIRAGKSHRERTLPLEEQIDQALVGYLQHRRPRALYRRVFLQCHAQYGPLTNAKSRLVPLHATAAALRRIPAVNDKRSELTIFFIGHADGVPNESTQNNRTKQVIRWKARGHIEFGS